MKKLLTITPLLLCFCFLLSLTSCNKKNNKEPIEEPIGVEGLEYMLSTDESMYAIKSIGTCNIKEIELPTEYNGKPVKIIAWDAFQGSAIEKIIIPEGYTEIYAGAFMSCKSLISVTLPNTLTSIGASAFANCISLPEIKIPDSVVSLGSEAFYCCDSLSNVTISKNISYFFPTTFEFTPFIKNEVKTIDGVQYLENYIISVELLNVPKNLTIREGTFIIPDDAFSGCSNLEKVVLPESLRYIGDKAFKDCYSLQEINIPDSVKYVGSWAFANDNNLKSAEYSGCIYIDNHLIDSYDACSNMKVREGTITISPDAFVWADMSTLYIPKSVEYIAPDALQSQQYLRQITVDDSNKHYKTVDGVLYNKALTELICYPAKRSGILLIPDTVELINSRTFSYTPTNLTAIVLPSSVKQMDDYAFQMITEETHVFYCGTADDYLQISKGFQVWGPPYHVDITVYYYSESAPTNNSENLWHYVDGVPTIWN